MIEELNIEYLCREDIGVIMEAYEEYLDIERLVNNFVEYDKVLSEFIDSYEKSEDGRDIVDEYVEEPFKSAFSNTFIKYRGCNIYEDNFVASMGNMTFMVSKGKDGKAYIDSYGIAMADITDCADRGCITKEKLESLIDKINKGEVEIREC